VRLEPSEHERLVCAADEDGLTRSECPRAVLVAASDSVGTATVDS
jgi:hypothetical protein